MALKDNPLFGGPTPEYLTEDEARYKAHEMGGLVELDMHDCSLPEHPDRKGQRVFVFTCPTCGSVYDLMGSGFWFAVTRTFRPVKREELS